MKTLFLIVTLLLSSVTFSFAQTPVVTQPKGVTSNNSSSTISSSNVFQSIWAANSNRTACTIQNNGTHNMWVFFGAIANATENNSVVLQAGQYLNCNSGNVILQDQVSITGTSTDAFFAAQQ